MKEKKQKEILEYFVYFSILGQTRAIYQIHLTKGCDVSTFWGTYIRKKNCEKGTIWRGMIAENKLDKIQVSTVGRRRKNPALFSPPYKASSGCTSRLSYLQSTQIQIWVGWGTNRQSHWWMDIETYRLNQLTENTKFLTKKGYQPSKKLV